MNATLRADQPQPMTFVASALCARLESAGLRATVYFAEDHASGSVIVKAVVQKSDTQDERSVRLVLTPTDLDLSLDDLLEKLAPAIGGLTFTRAPDGPVSSVRLEEGG